MRIVLQKVLAGSVEVEGEIVGNIGEGLLLLVGFGIGDAEEALPKAADKIVNLRIFPNDQGKPHFSALELKREILAIPQFTLYGDTTKGRRPEFFGALAPNLASPLFDKFCDALIKSGVSKVARGVFQAHMKVSLVNDGPVTLILDF